MDPPAGRSIYYSDLLVSWAFRTTVHREKDSLQIWKQCCKKSVCSIIHQYAERMELKHCTGVLKVVFGLGYMIM